VTELNEEQRSAEDGQPEPARHSLPTKTARRLPGPIPKRAWFVLVPSVLAVIGLSFALVNVLAAPGPHGTAALGAGSHPSALGSASPNPDSTEPVPTFQVPAKAIPVTAPRTDALPLPKDLQAQVRAWDAGRGGAALAAVSTQVGDVTQASGLREYVAMRAACSRLATSVATAQASPPIPDAAMQTAYATALTKLARGARECRAAISQQPDGDEYIVTTENPAKLRASAAALASGSHDLFRATGEIVALRHGR
jgi:hypothetical protein